MTRFIEDGDGGADGDGEAVGGSNTSVNNIATYRTILTKTLKRKKVFDVNQEDYDKIKTDIDYSNKFATDFPVIFKCGTKYNLVY